MSIILFFAKLHPRCPIFRYNNRKTYDMSEAFISKFGNGRWKLENACTLPWRTPIQNFKNSSQNLQFQIFNINFANADRLCDALLLGLKWVGMQ